MTGCPGWWKSVNARNESLLPILSRLLMNIRKFDSAFAVEIETMPSDDSSLSGSQDELART